MEDNMKYLKLFEAFGGDQYEEYFTDLLDCGYKIIHNSYAWKPDRNITIAKILDEKDLKVFDKYNKGANLVITKTKYNTTTNVDSFYSPLFEILIESLQRLISIEGFYMATVSTLTSSFYDPNTYDILYRIVIKIDLT